MNFLKELSSSKPLRAIGAEDIKDRSGAALRYQTADELENEAKHWEAFFQSGCGAWFDYIKELTFSSTFCTLLPKEARIIVSHWDDLRRLRTRLVVDDASEEKIAEAIATLLATAVVALESLRERLEVAINIEAKLSPVGKAFVKLSTRSPKDSKKALARAEQVYKARLSVVEATQGPVDANCRWRILCEETTNAGAVSNAADALELLLDSDRVYEDLEYALRGPTGKPPTEVTCSGVDVDVAKLQWRTDLVARAWDPRLTPSSEFRGICWGGKLTCLCQYFHPLLFEELAEKKEQILSDILAVFAGPQVTAAVQGLGGHCIVDFAWLGPGEVVVVELNPFDGVCLGVFPASTGLFLWDNPIDHEIMKGSSPFEFRLRECPLLPHQLKAQCNKDWRDIVYANGRD
jgi:hypothetical protein